MSLPPLQSISDLSKEWLAEVLTISTSKPTTVSTFSIESDLDATDGFFSSIFAVNVATNHGIFSLVLKLLPDDTNSLKEIVSELYIAVRENEFYNFILKGSFQNISPSSPLPIPKVYYSEYSQDKFTLVMENLTSKGYKSIGSADGIDLVSTTAAFKSIAQVHACGYRYIEINGPDSLRAFQTSEDDYYKLMDEELKIGVNLCCDLLKEDSLCEKLKTFCINKTYRNLEVDKCNAQGLPHTIIHGDYWSGQTMFNENKDTCIIDWQFVNFSNPTNDLTSFFLMSCGGESLNYLDELLRAYTLALNECLALLKSMHRFELEEVKKSFEISLARGLWILLSSVNSFLKNNKISEERLLQIIKYVDTKGLFPNKR